MEEKPITMLCLLLFALIPRPSMSSAVQSPCQLPAPSATEQLSTEGDVLIGAVTPLHAKLVRQKVTFLQPPEQPPCQQFKARFFLDALGMLFAVEEANRDPNFLPNVTVGFQLYDSCVSGTRALGSTLGLLSGQLLPTPNFDCHPQHRLLGIIGGMTSPESEAMAELLSVYQVSQISHGSQHPQFSDHQRFPSFLRTVPSRVHQPQALAKILLYFNWTWVGLVGSDSGAFEWLDQEFRKEVGKNGGCVSFSKRIDGHINNVGDVADAIWNSTAKVIICDCYHIHFVLLAKALQEKSMTNRIWLMSTSFLLDASVLSREAREMLNGSLSLGIHSGPIPGFKHFLSTLRPAMYPENHLVKLFWQELLGCTWPGPKSVDNQAGSVVQNCTGLEQLTQLHLSVLNLDDLTATYQAYLAAKAFLVAYQNLRACSPREGPFTGSNCTRTEDARPWQFLHYLKAVCFTTRAQEEIFFTQDGEIPAIFDIVNIYLALNHTLQTVKVGHLDFREPPGQELVINSSTIIWAEGLGKVPLSVCSKTCPLGTRKSAIQGQPSCCYQCLHCPKGEIAYISDSASCFKCPEDQWPNNEKDRCIPKILDFLSYTEPLGMALAFCTAFLFLLSLTILGTFIHHHHTPIVRANNHRLSYILLCSLALCFLCPFMFIGPPVPLTCALRQAAFGIFFTVCVCATLAKTIIVVSAFRATRPDARLKRAGLNLPSAILIGFSLVQVVLCMFWVIGWPPVPVNSAEAGPTVTMLCGSGSSEFFYTMLGYLGFLALVSLVVAFLARRLPDTFNEAKHITLSMLVFSCVWISFIPAHLSAQGKDTVAVEIFAILASGAGLMGCLFFPKCYIILLRPEKNTRDQMRGKQHFKK
ncbi:extracellular calcium-sensing receptor-like [Sminthopsis crassicaudata]|uniref:extracellular calcium-sensing receptor-like n=1 Tax=Sminthopsis crassicaudata TaxID=9301 RepID=UPI003D6926A4